MTRYWKRCQLSKWLDIEKRFQLPKWLDVEKDFKWLNIPILSNCIHYWLGYDFAE